MIENFPSTSLGTIVLSIEPSLKRRIGSRHAMLYIDSAAEIESYAQYLLDISLKLQIDSQYYDQ